jgi:hypothetical protein
MVEEVLNLLDYSFTNETQALEVIEYLNNLIGSGYFSDVYGSEFDPTFNINLTSRNVQFSITRDPNNLDSFKITTKTYRVKNPSTGKYEFITNPKAEIYSQDTKSLIKAGVEGARVRVPYDPKESEVIPYGASQFKIENGVLVEETWDVKEQFDFMLENFKTNFTNVKLKDGSTASVRADRMVFISYLPTIYDSQNNPIGAKPKAPTPPPVLTELESSSNPNNQPKFYEATEGEFVTLAKMKTLVQELKDNASPENTNLPTNTFSEIEEQLLQLAINTLGKSAVIKFVTSSTAEVNGVRPFIQIRLKEDGSPFTYDEIGAPIPEGKNGNSLTTVTKVIEVDTQSFNNIDYRNENLKVGFMEEVVHALSVEQLKNPEVQSSQEYKRLEKIRKDLLNEVKTGNLVLSEEELIEFEYYTDSIEEFLIAPYRPVMSNILNRSKVKYPSEGKKKNWESLLEFIKDNIKDLFNTISGIVRKKNPSLEEAITVDSLAIILNNINQKQATPKQAAELKEVPVETPVETPVEQIVTEVGEPIEALEGTKPFPNPTPDPTVEGLLGLKRTKIIKHKSIIPALTERFNTPESTKEMFKDLATIKSAANYVDIIVSNILWNAGIYTEFIQNMYEPSSIINAVKNQLEAEIQITKDPTRINFLNYLNENIEEIWLNNSPLLEEMNANIAYVSKAVEGDGIIENNDLTVDAEENVDYSDEGSDSDVPSKYKDRTEQTESSFTIGGRLSKIFLRTVPKIERYDIVKTQIDTGEVDEVGNPIMQTVVSKNPVFYRDEYGNFVPVDITAIWNTISDKVAGALTLEEMIEKLSTGYNKFKEVDLIVERLKSIKSDPANVFFLKDFEKSFQMFYVPTLLTDMIPVMDENIRGSYDPVSYTSNRLDSLNIQALLAAKLRYKFSSTEGRNFLVGPFLNYLEVMEDMKEKINLSNLGNNNRIAEAKKDVKKYWKSIGIEIPSDSPLKSIKEYEKDLLEFTKALYLKFAAMKKAEITPEQAGIVDFDLFEFVKKNTVIPVGGKDVSFYGNKFVVPSLFNTLSEVLPYATSNMTKNAEGKNQSNLHQASTYLITAELLNRLPIAIREGNTEMLQYIYQSIPRLNNPVTKHSWLYKNLIKGKSINVVNISGVLGEKDSSGRTKGKNTINLDIIEYLKQEFHLLLKKGLVENLRAETASTTFGAYIESTSATAATPILLGSSVRGSSQSIFFGYLQGEVERIYKEYKFDLENSDVTFYERNPYTNKRFEFTYLDGVLNPILKERIYKLITDAIEANQSLDSVLNKLSDKEFKEDFNADIVNLIEDVRENFTDFIIRETGLTPSLSHPAFDITTVYEAYQGIAVDTNQTPQQALMDFIAMNRFILALENTILFNGEIGIYDKFYKRAKSPISNGTPFVISNLTSKFLKDYAQGRTFTEAVTGKRAPYLTDASKVDSIVIEDDRMSTSPEVLKLQKKGILGAIRNANKFFKKKISKEELDSLANEALEGQNRITASDGDGVCHPDFYRVLLLGTNSWSDEREEGYQYLGLKYKKSKGITLDTEELEFIQYVDDRIEQEGYYFDFPKVKFQYAGPSTPVRYSIEGGQEGKLTQDQVKDLGIGTRVEDTLVVSPETLDKFSLLPLFPEMIKGTKAEALFEVMSEYNIGYAKFRTGTKTYQFEGNRIEDIKKGMKPKGIHSNQTIFLKEQVKTSDGAYDETLLGTQVRKLLISNLSLNGKFMRTVSKNYKKWKSSQREYAEIARRDLLLELGATPEAIANSKDVANIEIDLNKLLDLVRKEFATRDLPASIVNYFLRDFEFNPNSPNKDYLETSISPKIIENLLYSLLKNRIVKPKVKGAAFIVVSNSLFTELDNEGNVIRDLETYVPVIINGRVKEIKRAGCKVTLQGDYLNLLNLPEVVETGGDINALNALLKNEDFREKHKKSLTIFTSRIPNQGYNSDDAFEIRKFLPPYITNTLIPNEAIVDKTGMDFDYDKLPAITASIDNNGVYISQENTDRSIAEMSREDFTTYIDGLKEELSANFSKEEVEEIKSSRDYIKAEIIQVKEEIKLLKAEKEELKKLLGKKAEGKKTKKGKTTLDKIKEVNVKLKPLYERKMLLYSSLQTAREDLGQKYEVLNRYKDLINTAYRSRRLDSVYSNEMLESSSGIILNPINFYRLIRPNTTSIINKSVYRILRKLYNLPSTMSDKEVARRVNPEPSNTTIFYPSTHYGKFLSVKLKDNLGISAVNNVYYSLMQEVNYKINKIYNLKNVQTRFELPLIPAKDKAESSISNPFFANTTLDKLEVINQFINIFVDAASDDTAGKTNLKKENLGFGIFQLLNGVTLDNVLSFLHQPAIYQYGFLKAFYLNNGYTNSEARKAAIGRLLNVEVQVPVRNSQTLTRFVSDEELWENLSTYYIPEFFDEVELYENITNPYELTLENKDLELSIDQKEILVYYLKGLEEAEMFRKAQSTTNFDKSPYNSLNLNEIRNASIQQVEEDGLIDVNSVLKIYSDSVISHLDILPEFRTLSEKLFPVKNYPPFKALVAEMGMNISSGQLEKFSNAIDNDFLMYIIQNFSKDFNEEKINYLKDLSRANGLMTRWVQLVEKYKLQDTNLAQKLYPNSTRYGSVNPALFMGLDSGAKEFDYISKEIQTMLSLTGTDEQSVELRQFAQDLLELGFFQTGFNTSPIYILKVFPENYLRKFEDAFKKFDKLSPEEKNTHLYRFRYKFLENRVLEFGKSFINEYGGGQGFEGYKNLASGEGFRLLNYIYNANDAVMHSGVLSAIMTNSEKKKNKILMMNARLALQKAMDNEKTELEELDTEMDEDIDIEVETEVETEKETKPKIVELPKRNLFTVTPIQAADKKAVIKASIATKYIGFGEGIEGSSTELYRQQAGSFANTGNYSSDDVVFVSIGGKRPAKNLKLRKAQQDRTIEEALTAIEAGAILITDNKDYVQKSDYNEGEKRLAEKLLKSGYSYFDITIDGQELGMWKNEKGIRKTPLDKVPVTFQNLNLFTEEEKQTIIVNFMKTYSSFPDATSVIEYINEALSDPNRVDKAIEILQSECKKR